MGGSFLNSFMPTLPWWFLGIGLVSIAMWLAVTAVRLMTAEQRRVERPARALRQAKDALAAVISDSAVFGDARSQALSAYDSVADALKKEKGN
jgi:threonine/homoserine/homoserine lactone efflux protein